MGRHLICGLGQVGIRVAELLIRLGEEVTVVTTAGQEEFVEKIKLWGGQVVLGDARNDRNLLQAGIQTADSIIVITESDMTNIEISLDAARLNPEIQVVIRLFDQSLAKHLGTSFGINRALGMAMLAAPAFATAAFGEAVRGSFSWCGKKYLVGELPGSEDLSRASKKGLCAFIRAQSISDRLYQPTPEICSKGHFSVELICEQEQFLKFGTVSSETMLAAKIASRNARVKATHDNHRINTWKTIWANTPPLLKRVSLTIAVLSIISFFVFWYGMGISPIDAFYFVVTTLTTTGYGDITVKDQEVWLKLYVCFMMLVGSAAVATLYSIVTDFVVSTRFDQVLGQKRATTDDHVIVVGLSNVGFRTIAALREMEVGVVAIDIEASAQYRSLLGRDTPFVSGDARDPSTLREAGIERATAIVTATTDDAINLSAALTAKHLNPEVRTVVRLFEPEFARKVQRSLNVNYAMSATRIAAPNFVGSSLVEDPVFCAVIGERFLLIRPAKDHPKPHPMAKCSFVAFEQQDGGLRIDMLPLKDLNSA